MKTSDLTGAALDWAVAKCDGVPVESPDFNLRFISAWDYSTNWAHGGPILDRERPRISPTLSGGFTVSKKIVEMLDDGGFNTRWAHGTGPTILAAAMRCFVASKHGEEIEIPAELKA